MRLAENDARFIIGPSTVSGAGNGLFAVVDLALGDRLEVIGIPLDPEGITNRCTHFADAHKFRIPGGLLLPLGYGGIVNHSPTPNLEKRFEEGVLYLCALRKIAAGEELFFTYADYARSHFLPEGA